MSISSILIVDFLVVLGFCLLLFSVSKSDSFSPISVFHPLPLIGLSGMAVEITNLILFGVFGVSFWALIVPLLVIALSIAASFGFDYLVWYSKEKLYQKVEPLVVEEISKLNVEVQDFQHNFRKDGDTIRGDLHIFVRDSETAQSLKDDERRIQKRISEVYPNYKILVFYRAN